MPNTVDSNENVKATNAAEADFVSSFASKLASGEVGTDRGRAKADREAQEEATAAAPAPKKGESTVTADDDTSSTDTSTSTDAPSGESDDESDDTETGEADESETGGDAADDATEGTTDGDAAAAAGDKKKDDVDAETDDRDADDLTEDELAQEARAQLEKHGLKVTMDDLPPKARTLVQQKLAHANAAVTRALMDARSYRKDETQFRAEQSFMRAHPEFVFAELVAKDPALIERLQAMIDEQGTETGKKAQEVVIRDARREAVETIEQQNAAIERVNQRADAIESYVRGACQKLNLPFDIVVDAVVNKLNEKPDDARDLSNEEIDAVIGRQRRILAKHIGVSRVSQRRDEIRGRTQDRKTVSPAAKSTPAAAPAAASSHKKVPKNDAEFIDQFLSKGGARR